MPRGLDPVRHGSRAMAKASRVSITIVILCARSRLQQKSRRLGFLEHALRHTHRDPLSAWSWSARRRRHLQAAGGFAAPSALCRLLLEIGLGVRRDFAAAAIERSGHGCDMRD